MKTKVFTSIVLGVMLLGFQLSRAQDVIIDGSFDTTTVIQQYTETGPPIGCWTIMKNAGIDANATVESGVCKYQFANAGTEAWEVQLEQYGLTFLPEHTYRLSFDVKADAERWFGLYLGEYYGSWTTLIGWENYWQYATPDWKTITIDFNASCIFAMTKISFEMGGDNTGMYLDNISVIDLGPYTPSIGIIGTSLTGWIDDFDMQTTDGINYTLLNQPLVSGMVRFRQDNMWCYSWGNIDYPTGTAILYGPNIPVLSYGTFDITFNRETGEYSFVCVSNCPANIGLIGTAVPPNFDLAPDVNMSTNDGENYFLNGHFFVNGEAKFRKDDSWDVNWGNNTFPTGTASLGGLAIPVAAGGYTVMFNIVTGDYNFQIPSIGILGSALNGWDVDIDMQSTDGITYTLKHYPFIQGEVKFRLENNWDINWGDVSFPTGIGYQDGPNIPIPCTCTYDVTFNAMTGEYSFVLDDTEPPVIADFSSNPESLWPPNHKMIPVAINYSATDNCCGTITNVLQVWSNEPVNGLGDGDMAPDWIITDDHNLLLRAERSGKGTGRVYTINIVSTDASGNSSSQLITVAVPHDQMDLKISDASFKIGNQAETKSFKVSTWPNPSNQNFSLQVESASNEIIDVFVTDVIGRQISKFQSTNMKTLSFGDNLKPGIYVIKVMQGNHLETVKAVKK
jgi:hypothetical protein